MGQLQQELTRQLEEKRTEKLDDWWLQHLDQPEDDLIGEYRAFLQFRALADTEHMHLSEQLLHAFTSTFADSVSTETEDAALAERSGQHFLNNGNYREHDMMRSI